MEIQKVICLSTAHVTQQDSERLSEDAGDVRFSMNPVFTANHNYGHFVYVPQDDRGVSQLCNDAREYGYSTSFVRLLRFGAANECRYLHLDCDGPSYPDQPLDIHDW